jgi:hypothetical protein
MTPEHKAWIDNASYEELLRKWRFAPIGDSFFQGDTGAYYGGALAAKRDADPDAAVAASKRIGW